MMPPRAISWEVARTSLAVKNHFYVTEMDARDEPDGRRARPRRARPGGEQRQDPRRDARRPRGDPRLFRSKPKRAAAGLRGTTRVPVHRSVLNRGFRPARPAAFPEIKQPHHLPVRVPAAERT